MVKEEIDSMLCIGIPTFMHLNLVPPKSEELKKVGADIAVIGAPFEMGPSVGLPGASLGPRTIRLGSEELLSYNAEYSIAYPDYLKVVDCGDVAPIIGDVIASHERIEKAIAEILDANAIPILLGGDHSVPIASTRALHNKVKGKIGLIHFDSHHDTWDNIAGYKVNNATTLTRFAELERVDPTKIAQIGMSGYINSLDCKKRAKDLGITTFYRNEVYERGIEAVTEDALEIAHDGTDAVYLTIDIDVCDASIAPSTSVPAIGGLTAREMIKAVRMIAREGVDAFDVVEVSSTAMDANNITGRLAATLIYEFITTTALKRKSGK